MNVPVAQPLPAKHVARRAPRRSSGMYGEVAVHGGAAAIARIIDLSYEGCRIATDLPLSPGATVRLKVRKSSTDAKVRWAAGGEAGLVFSNDVPPPRPHVERAASRHAVDVDIVIRRLGKVKYRVAVHDLSPTGCKVDLIDRPRIGETMMVKFDSLDVLESAVCWVEEFVAGLRFARPIHPAVFALLLAEFEKSTKGPPGRSDDARPGRSVSPA